MGNQIIQAGRMLLQVLAPGAVGPTPGATYIYVGNTPSFSLSRAVETIKHYDSDGMGTKQVTDAIDLQDELSGTFTTDEVSVANLGLWMGAEAAPLSIALGANVTQNAVVRRGGYVVLGESAVNPSGVGAVTSVSITKASVAVPALNNWTLDADRGTVHFNPASATLLDNDAIVITYSNAARTLQRAQSNARTIYASIRFEGASRGGGTVPKNAVIPYAKLTSSGDLAMKGDDWMSMTFAIDAMKPQGFTTPALTISDGSLTPFVA